MKKNRAMSRRTLLFFFLLLAGFSYSASQAIRQEARVETLLSRMTLEEKAGQMTQLTIQALSESPQSADSEHVLDLEKARDAIVNGHIGSVLNVWDAAYTLDHWHQLLDQLQGIATRETRLQIPIIYGIDSVHGANYTAEGTIFPQNLAMAATWNPSLAEQAARFTAIETRASGIPWNFSPVADLGRQPLWSRFFETFGEDVHLASEMTRATVRGYQGSDLSSPDSVAATLKHFLGYSFPLTGKDRTPAWIPMRFLKEYFLPPFQAGLEAGARTVMINSGEINGIPVHADPSILTDLLREELGFAGVAVSDWEDIVKLHTVHRVADSLREAVRLAVLAGVDMSMTPYDTGFADHLVDLVKAGEIPESRLDTSVRRILTLKEELGLFESPVPSRELKSRVGTEAAREVSRQAAAEAVTLLKNDGLLPLSTEARILVTGPAAASLPALHGSWTYTWQGTEASLYPDDALTIVDALRARLAGELIYVPGTSMDEVIDIEAATRAASEADVIVACIGEPPSTEKPGDIEDLSLDPAQRKFVLALQDTGKPVILILVEGRPRIIRELTEGSSAILMAYQSGPFSGEALAGVLLGEINPSGRLPFTYPRYTGSLVPYDHKNAERHDNQFGENAFNPQFPFAHGLSYTRFSYTDLELDSDALVPGQTLQVSVRVANVGETAGKEVVQVYVSDHYASITPAVRRLRAFNKIELAPGESRQVSFRLTQDDLAFVGVQDRWVVEPGRFTVHVADLARDFDFNASQAIFR